MYKVYEVWAQVGDGSSGSEKIEGSDGQTRFTQEEAIATAEGIWDNGGFSLVLVWNTRRNRVVYVRNIFGRADY